MQLTEDTIDRALRALRKFRIGGALIAAIPLVPAFLVLLLGGKGGDSALFTIMSVCLTLLVIWGCHCAEQFLKAQRNGISAAS